MNPIVIQIHSRVTQSFGPLALVTATILCATVAAGCSTPRTEEFATPELAIEPLTTYADTQDPDLGARLFGEDIAIAEKRACELEAEEEREAARHVCQSIRERVAFADDGAGRKLIVIGNDEWVFPFPLVADGDHWRFDADQGAEEIDDRRIGWNELATIATLHEYVDAQREYASSSRDGNPPCFASRLRSSAGRHDGLFWPSSGDAHSPLGELVCAAEVDGTEVKDHEPATWHGYRFRPLLACGSHAEGGAGSYLDDDGRMTRGFALLAWPAEYGTSGWMTFVISDRGLVYEKDLGDETPAAAAAITAFDPDETWRLTEDG